VRIRFLLHTVYGRGGGVLTVTLRLAEDLASRHDVEVVSVLRTRDAPIFPMPQGARVVDLVDARPGSADHGLRGAADRWLTQRRSRLIPEGEPRFRQYSLHTDLAVARYLSAIRDGAVIAMQPGLNVALARLGRRQVVRVAQDHRPFVDRAPSVRAAYVRYAAGLDAFLTLTRRDARRYRKALGPGVNVRAMTNGTPAYQGPRSTLREPVVVAAGRLERSKGFDLLIDAWIQVARRHPDWQLRIYGSGSLERDLREQIRALGLEGSVHLMGFSTALQEEMSRCSLFVLSSRSEGYGMVLVEAMATGVPVVSFDCPTGPREIIHHGRDGLLVPNRDVAAMAAALNQMIELGPDGLRPMAQAATETAYRRSQPVVSARWEELLEDLSRRKR
jgi:glycosyltransferase involved in cell wall biosynthesis